MKIGAVIRVSVRRVLVQLASGYPWQELFYEGHYSSVCLNKNVNCPATCVNRRGAKGTGPCCPPYIPDFVKLAEAYEVPVSYFFQEPERVVAAKPAEIREKDLFPKGLLPLPGRGETLVQPLWVEDMATCLAWALDDPDTMNKTYEVGGSEALTLRQDPVFS